ncbi:ABC transporter ATP-binding protein [Enterococcus gallinarum]|uniref:ABC transporter ATP-binding protein n=1 Tax=Enterococcus gallinarum TaxID=1353 RepID=UPI001C60EA13|nr:ABC transporter ATP-binding protein [Enterococcus gallinarum]MBW5471892.1 ATP-binding cassette domain-containing protein [Enterococcus gallinarum]MDT2695699.1 ABC transporter ATP-binding protein [Enterococcus gallinarum]UJA24517.1 ABC transporter ATP-binding protein [Enterococcus gallinarum]
MTEPLLTVKNLNVFFHRKQGDQQLLKEIDLVIPKGQVVGIVGESGSGKSMTMKSVMGILPENISDSFDSFVFEGQPVVDRSKLPLAMIFQDPMTSLNPLRTIGYHLIEVIRRHQKMSKKAAQTIAIAELNKVGIPLPEQRMKQYPHELSGGMRQRVMIAMALLAQSKLLIADEPTTALDVTIQAQILALIKQLQRAENLSVVLVTHDFGVVAGMCDFIKVMYQGRVVEEGTTEEIFYQPQHLYTKQLLEAAHLGDKEETVVFDYQEELPDVLHVREISETHRVWEGGASN